MYVYISLSVCILIVHVLGVPNTDTCTYISLYLYVSGLCISAPEMHNPDKYRYGVASISRLLKIIGHFCKRALKIGHFYKRAL